MKLLNIAKSIGQAWQIVKSKEVNAKAKYKLLLKLNKIPESKPDEAKPLDDKIIENIPEEILELKKERDLARLEKDWQKTDELREEIEKGGYILEDRDSESTLKKRD